MSARRILSVLGLIGLTLIFIIVAAKSPVTVAMREAGQSHESDPAIWPPSSAGTFINGTITASTLSCREGLTGWEPYLSSGIDIQSLGGGIYLDFGLHVPFPQPNAMEYIQMVRVNQNKDDNGHYLQSYTIVPPLSDLEPIIASAPGSLWLIGNEPDRGPNIGSRARVQDDTYPAIYARAFHEIYSFIKEHDQSALMANAGLVEVTPGRMQYLEIVWDTYMSLYHEPIPVDVWNIHLYILPEVDGIASTALGTDPALAYTHIFTHTIGEPNRYTFGDHDNLTLFDSQVRRMRQWMKDHGQEDKPLLLSEFGLLYGETVTDEFGVKYTMPRATAFLEKTFNYLSTASDPNIGMPSDNNRLVQQWVWFSTHSSLGYISNLVTDTLPLTFTPVGEMFRTNVASRPLASNLQPRLVGGIAPILTPGNTSVTVTLSVQVVNNGNQLVTEPLIVTFYSDAALTQVIGSVLVDDDIPGCARRRVTANMVWPDLDAGSHSYWIKVDSSNAIAETNETDNVVGGQVFVGAYRMYLPSVTKNLP